MTDHEQKESHWWKWQRARLNAGSDSLGFVQQADKFPQITSMTEPCSKPQREIRVCP